MRVMVAIPSELNMWTWYDKVARGIGMSVTKENVILMSPEQARIIGNRLLEYAEKVEEKLKGDQK